MDFGTQFREGNNSMKRLETGKRQETGWPSRGIAAALILLCAGCNAATTRANRPISIDLARFKPGQQRFEVLTQMGYPVRTTPDPGGSCDIYQLYTEALSRDDNMKIAVAEGVASELTLGLSNIIAGPVEASVQDYKHEVSFCYDKQGELTTVVTSDRRIGP